MAEGDERDFFGPADHQLFRQPLGSLPDCGYYRGLVAIVWDS